MTNAEFDTIMKEARDHTRHTTFAALESEHDHGYETDHEGQDVTHEAFTADRYEDPLR